MQTSFNLTNLYNTDAAWDLLLQTWFILGLGFHFSSYSLNIFKIKFSLFSQVGFVVYKYKEDFSKVLKISLLLFFQFLNYCCIKYPLINTLQLIPTNSALKTNEKAKNICLFKQKYFNCRFFFLFFFFIIITYLFFWQVNSSVFLNMRNLSINELQTK